MPNDKKTNLQHAMDSYLDCQPPEINPDMDCSSGVCVIKGDKSLVEKINKKIITEDGRQLLI
jgi:hypothetical protein